MTAAEEVAVAPLEQELLGVDECFALSDLVVRDERTESTDEVERLENHGVGPVLPGPLGRSLSEHESVGDP